MMNIDCFYNDFLKNMTLHDKNHNLSLQFIQNQINEINNKYSLLDNNTKIYYENSQFYLWENSKKTFEIYDERNITIDMLCKDLVNHQNMQYQWLLVSAFEDFVTFLKKSYSYMICIDCKPKDFEISEYQNNCDDIYSLILDNLSNRNAPYILKKLRNKLSNYNYLEINNNQNIDMKFLLNMIYNFRNIIVHKYGITNDKNQLFNEIMRNIGITGEKIETYLKIFNMYFSNDTDKITLLEIPVFNNNECSMVQTTILQNLFSVLLNSAYYLFKEIKEKYDF